MPLKLQNLLPLTAPAKSITPLNTNSSTKHHPASRTLIPDEKNHLRPNLPTNNHQPKTSSNSSSPLTRSSQQKLLRTHPTIAHFFFVYVLKRRLRIRFNREWSTKNMGSSRSSILCFLMLCASFLVPTSCHSYSHGALFIFGDSFYDAGNNIYLNTSNTSLAKLNIFPYGETYFKHPTGRVSDGRLIPDFIVKYNTWQFFFSLFLISALFFLFWNRLLDIYIEFPYHGLAGHQINLLGCCYD